MHDTIDFDSCPEITQTAVSGTNFLEKSRKLRFPALPFAQCFSGNAHQRRSMLEWHSIRDLHGLALGQAGIAREARRKG